MRRLVILIFLGLLLGGVAAAYYPFLRGYYEWGRLSLLLHLKAGTTSKEASEEVRTLLRKYDVDHSWDGLDFSPFEFEPTVELPEEPICNHPDRNLIFQRISESPLVVGVAIPEDAPPLSKTEYHFDCRWTSPRMTWTITFAEGVDEKTIRDFLSQFPDIGIEEMRVREFEGFFEISVPPGLEWFWKIRIEMDKDPRVERVDFVKVPPAITQ